MLKKIRVIIAALFFILLTLLFLDFTGTMHQWLGWMAKIQLIPAILAVNVVIIVSLVFLTFIFGRVYCSVICPLGVFQDGISHIAGTLKRKKNRYGFSPALRWLRYGMLGLFVIAMVIGVSAIVSLFDPYAAYGRMASNFFAPLYKLGNNILASLSEKADSYALYSTEVWIKSWITFGVALITFFAVAILAWRNGRTYCNTICPVGTALGFLSKFSIFRITLDTEKCTKCNTCERNCKSSCIDIKTTSIDNSRCVTCFNCIEKCKYGAISYSLRSFNKGNNEITRKKAVKNGEYVAPEKTGFEEKNEIIVEKSVDEKATAKGVSRRDIFSIVGSLAVGSSLNAQQLVNVDGGLAPIEDKKSPVRKTPLTPPGASGTANLKRRCTACQLCVSACPSNVLRPSNVFATFMQPEMSFEKGYCRPECVECSLVCPSGAITAITAAEKTAVSIGHAVFIKENCVVNKDEIQCESCERHCPTKAIILVDRNPGEKNSLKIPVVNDELCIGCGACEYLCPARPFSAIYIEGNVRHHFIK